MNNIKDKVLERITVEHATPAPRRHFILRNILMWMLASLSLGFGACAVATLIFRLNNIPRFLPPEGIASGGAYLFLAFAPIFWVATLVGFTYLAYLEIRSTNRGYRYELHTIIGVLVLSSVVFGAALYSAGSGFVLDRLVTRHVPFHESIEDIERERWLKPREGFLVGEVSELSENGFVLTDPENTPWTVVFGDSIHEREKMLIKEHKRVGIIGKVYDETTVEFLACAIRPLEIRGRGLFAPARGADVLGDEARKMFHERIAMRGRSNECEGVRPPDITR